MNRARGGDRPTFEQLQADVARGERPLFVLLHGEEEYERDVACRWLVEQLTPAQAPEFNVDAFRGEEMTLDAVPALVGVYCSYPVLAPHRLVILRDPERLSAEACKALELLTDRPADSTVLLVAGGKVDLRRRFFRDLAAKGRAVEFRPPYDNQISAWLVRCARQQGLAIDADAADLLHACVGNHLRELAGELAKLSLLAGETRRITRRTVEVATGGARLAGIFQLTDALGRRDGRRALALVRQLLAQGEEAPRVVAMALRHFQLLGRAQALLPLRPAPEQMAKSLGVSLHFLPGYLEQARALTAAAVLACLGALLEADSRLKSLGRRQEPLVLELLVARVAGMPVAAGRS